MSLCLHCGAHAASLEEIAAIPLPEETSTYKPLSHYDFTMKLLQTGKDILEHKGLRFQDLSLALNKEGQQMFGIMSFTNDIPDMGLSLGFRNSYDKSMVAGIAIGTTVFVCDNLAFMGESVIARKHTGGILQELEDRIVVTLYKTHSAWTDLMCDIKIMKEKEIYDDRAHEILGAAFGRELISPRQLSKISHEWRHPTYEEFTPRNMWSLYNAITIIYKGLPIHEIISKHVRLHTFMREVI